MTEAPRRAPDEVPTYRSEPLPSILTDIRARLAAGADIITFAVLDPDHARGLFPGESPTAHDRPHIHRPYRVWVDLASRLGLRMLTPRRISPPLIELRFERLDPAADWHNTPSPDPAEKYGATSTFARISKLEDPDFVLDFTDAIERTGLTPDARVLELGVNCGDALTLLSTLVPGLAERGDLVGVDHSASALDVARTRLPRARLLTADLATLADLDLGGRFDLIIALDTLQSSGLDDRNLLRRLVQDHLAPRGSLVLGMPNCRYLDGETIHGARMRNFRQPELGLLFKDVAFYRKYLQQHARTVYITGKHEILITAVPI